MEQLTRSDLIERIMDCVVDTVQTWVIQGQYDELYNYIYEMENMKHRSVQELIDIAGGLSLLEDLDWGENDEIEVVDDIAEEEDGSKDTP
jgi:hypothetical protein